jgi:putative molybdopterin biosynthesis protein
LVCLKSALDQPAILALRKFLQSQAWQRDLAAMAGYQPMACGDVLSLRQLLPWWSFGDKNGH